MGRLRQLVLVAKNYEEAADSATRLLDSFVTYNDPGLSYFGLKNGLIPIGREFLEIVAPLDETNLSSSAGGRYLERFGEGGYMVIVQLSPEKMLQARTRARELRLRIVHEGSRQQSDLESFPLTVDGPGFKTDGIAGFHLHPKDVGAITEIATQRPSYMWAWAGNSWTEPEERMKIGLSPTKGFAGVTIATPNHKQKAELWAYLLDLNPEQIAIAQDHSKVILDDDSFLLFREPQSSSENGVVQLHIFSELQMYHNNPRHKLIGAEIIFVPPHSKL